MFLGLDLGTGSLKALILNGSGQVQAVAAAPCAVQHPQPGWAESDPAAWWQAAVTACAGLPQDLRRQVQGIGCSGQMHGLVLADERGQPLRPALLWLDARTAPLLEAYRRTAEEVEPRLANPVTAGMFGPALLWVRKHDPQVYERARFALLPKDWLRWQLTGVAASEPSDVSGTLLSTPDGQWHAGLVAALGLKAALLPRVVASHAVTGELLPERAAELGLAAGLPVVAGAGDTAASLFSSGLLPGEAQVTVGSAAQIVRRLTQAAPHPALQLYRAATPDWYALAAIQNAGLALEWVRELLGLDWNAVYAQAFAREAAPDLAFLPYLTGERTPLMDHRACGSWSGLRLGHSRAQLMRAALEGVAFALRDGLDTLEAAHGPLEQLRLTGGGTRQPRWQQLLADALGQPLTLGEVKDASGRGAALLAQWGVTGQLPALEQAAATETVRPSTVRPGAEYGAVQERFMRWKALQRTLKPWWEGS